MKNRTLEGALRFKPLWRIHNATYRRCVKGYTAKRLRRYIRKIQKLMGMKRM